MTPVTRNINITEACSVQWYYRGRNSAIGAQKTFLTTLLNVCGQKKLILAVLGPTKASYPIGIEGWSPTGVNRQKREASHSPPSIAEVKKIVELYLHSNISSRHVIICRDNFSF
jgi:hypothetical protein